MKIAIYGQDPMMKRIQRALNAQGDETVVVEAIETVETSGCALAFVDMTAPAAKNACAFLKEKLDMPVILVLGFGDDGFKTMDEIRAEGYISRTANESELAARLKALERRIKAAAK